MALRKIAGLAIQWIGNGVDDDIIIDLKKDSIQITPAQSGGNLLSPVDIRTVIVSGAILKSFDYWPKTNQLEVRFTAVPEDKITGNITAIAEYE